MAYRNILYQVSKQAAVITMNRPEKRNALDPLMWDELALALKQADQDQAAGVIILTGSGKAFCAGDDIAVLSDLENSGGGEALVMKSIYGLVESIIRLTKPLISAVNGYAFGAGCEMTLLSDLAIASEQATFAVPEARVGVCPLIFSVFGPPTLGLKASNEMTLLGERVNAQKAAELGLVNRVVPHEELMPAATEMARQILASSPLAMRIIKQTSNRILNQHLHDFWVLCHRTLGEIFTSQDFREGAAAFTEKRAPRFSGR